MNQGIEATHRVHTDDPTWPHSRPGTRSMIPATVRSAVPAVGLTGDSIPKSDPRAVGAAGGLDHGDAPPWPDRAYRRRRHLPTSLTRQR